MGAAPVAHAQDFNMTAQTQPTNYVTPEAGAASASTPDVSSYYTPSPITGAGATAQSASTVTILPAPGSTAPNDPNLGGDTASQMGTVMTWIMSLFAWLVGVAALLLDYVVYYTVVTMGNYVKDIAAVGVAWRIIRDAANIMLIFGFLAIGITTILNVDWYGSAKQLLPKLVIAAVLINFSLFICEAMIDGTNLIATQFYTQISGGALPTMTGTGGTGLAINGVNLNTANEPISNAIMGQLGLQTIYDVNKNPKALDGGHTWFVGFMGIILFMITAFVLFSLSFILIARFVSLIFFILLSPIGFTGWALPLMQYRAGQWWKNFLQQIITAPVLLLLLYVALTVITDAQFLTGFNSSSNGWLGLDSGDITGFAGMLLSFLVAMGLLMVVVIKARSMSAFGAGWATATAGALTLGATAYGMSSILNTGALGARRALQRYAPNSRVSRVASRVLRPAENARMDIRAIPGVRAGLTAVGAGAAANPIERSAVGQIRQGVEGFRSAGREANRQYERETRVPLITRLTQAIQTGNAQQITQALGSMSNQEAEGSQIVGLLADNALAVALLPQNRFDALIQSENISDNDKARLRTARANDPRFAAANVAGTLAGMSTDQRSQLGGNILTQPNVMPLLDASDFNAIQRRGQLAPAQRAAMGTYILGVLTNPGVPAPANLTVASAAPAFRAYYNLP